MKALLILAGVAAIFSIAFFVSKDNQLSSLEETEEQKQFFNFIMEFNKNYNDNGEFHVRYSNFKKSLEAIRQLNG